MSNAALGIKKVYISKLLAAVFAALGETVVIFFDKPGKEAIAGALMIVALAALVVSAVLEFFGLKKAALDEAGYKTAYQLALGALLVLAVTIVLKLVLKVNTDSVTNATIYHIVGIFITYFVIDTTTKRLVKLGHGDIAAEGKTVMSGIFIAYIADAVTALLAVILKTGSKPLLVAESVTNGLVLAAELYYIYFLGKSWKNL